jgi:hypothetical protein
MLKLPKEIVEDPRHDAVVARLAANAGPLWERGQNQVPTVPLGEALAGELRTALVANLACQGLEQITERLRGEQKGLDVVNAREPTRPVAERVSRVLFVANDGSPRFYRDADALLTQYRTRLIACRLDVAGEELGARLLGEARMMRSVLIIDKRAAGRALLALV